MDEPADRSSLSGTQGPVSTNQERRAERASVCANGGQARREKQLKIGAAAVVVVVLVGIVAIVVWNKTEEARAEVRGQLIACSTPRLHRLRKIDPADYEDQPEVVAEVRRFNEQIDTIAESKRDGEAPTGRPAPSLAPPGDCDLVTVRSSCSTGGLRATSPASSDSRSRVLRRDRVPPSDRRRGESALSVLSVATLERASPGRAIR